LVQIHLLLPTPLSLNPILCLRILDGLPLHIAGRIGATSAERDNMIYNVPWTLAGRLACGWTGLLSLKFRSGGMAPDGLGINRHNEKCRKQNGEYADQSSRKWLHVLLAPTIGWLECKLYHIT
jgi:hypothetical protein